jgi:hypothetical protein
MVSVPSGRHIAREEGPELLICAHTRHALVRTSISMQYGIHFVPVAHMRNKKAQLSSQRCDDPPKLLRMGEQLRSRTRWRVRPLRARLKKVSDHTIPMKKST